MRVTETRLIELAAQGVQKNMERAGRASEVMSSGIRVNRPSEDPEAWAEGMRASARATLSAGRGSSIGSASDRLREADTALSTIGESLSRGLEVATQMANGTMNAEDRALAAREVAHLRAHILAAANTQGPDGEYLFAGSRGDTPPFDANGVYQGDTGVRSIEVGPAERLDVSMPGSFLTTANGVDVFGELTNLETALASNAPAGARAALTALTTAVGQVATTRTNVGRQLTALDAAEETRNDFEQRLTETYNRAVGADPIAAASELAQSRYALESAQRATQEIIALATRNG